MKRFTFLALAALTLGLFGCETNNQTDPTNELQPTVALEKSNEGVNSVTFNITTTNATEARYMVLEDEADAPTLETIMAEGVVVALDDKGAATVTVEDLEAETSYKVVAAAKNKSKMAGSNTIYFTTKSQADLTLSIDIVQVTHQSMNFRVNSVNAEKIAYLVLYATKDTPNEQYVLLNGEEVAVGSKESVEVTGLEHAKEYKLVVVAEGAGQTELVETPFTTEDDPDQVIKHNYTRARGTKYGSSYFMMFSYEDANEADNFAYNDKTLSLDIYGDPAKDYLPAGTYEVKESTEPDCVSSYRYSTYGYDNGVQLKSGQVVVAIDPDTKAYSFDIDLFLKDGRHLQATYTGDVDGMPVIDITTIATNFNKANASTADNGKNWTLNVEDAEGNKATFNLCNAFAANYIAKNIYVINTSTETMATRASLEAGQFDAETSSFYVAGEGEKRFLTGSLHVDIDWEAEKYMLAFFGTLEDNYVIEAEYEGAIDGVSLVQSEDIIEVMLNTAEACSYENNSNWYATFTQTDNGTETYRLVLDFWCPASEYLPAGYYRLNNSVDGRYLGIDATNLRITGEGQYYAVEANASVSIDMTNKSYSFDVSFKIEDGRTFKFAYVGEVNGMEVVEAEEIPDTVNWTSFVVKKWYSDNWALTIKDADSKYEISFDLRTGDSDLSYIKPGTYTIGGQSQYIDNNYSTFNGNKNSFKDATLVVAYDTDTKTYDVEFDITLVDDRQLTGEGTFTAE